MLQGSKKIPKCSCVEIMMRNVARETSFPPPFCVVVGVKALKHFWIFLIFFLQFSAYGTYIFAAFTSKHRFYFMTSSMSNYDRNAVSQVLQGSS